MDNVGDVGSHCDVCDEESLANFGSCQTFTHEFDHFVLFRTEAYSSGKIITQALPQVSDSPRHDDNLQKRASDDQFAAEYSADDPGN
jgi:hypothetical protein